MPMHFIVMDVIGKFKPLPQGHQFALIEMAILTNYTCFIPLLTKEADEVVHTYLVSI